MPKILFSNNLLNEIKGNTIRLLLTHEYSIRYNTQETVAVYKYLFEQITLINVSHFPTKATRRKTERAYLHLAPLMMLKQIPLKDLHGADKEANKKRTYRWLRKGLRLCSKNGGAEREEREGEKS